MFPPVRVAAPRPRPPMRPALAACLQQLRSRGVSYAAHPTLPLLHHRAATPTACCSGRPLPSCALDTLCIRSNRPLGWGGHLGQALGLRGSRESRGVCAGSGGSRSSSGAAETVVGEGCETLLAALDYEQTLGFPNSPGRAFPTFQAFAEAALEELRGEVALLAGSFSSDEAELGLHADTSSSLCNDHRPTFASLRVDVAALSKAARQYDQLSVAERVHFSSVARKVVQVYLHYAEADAAHAEEDLGPPEKNKEKEKVAPNFNFEQQLWSQGVSRVGGIDEAGVGALAGPVVAAVCILPRNATVETLAIEGINDSKKLSPKKREIVYEQLLKHPGVEFATAVLGPRDVDELNIYRATMEAMLQAVRGLHQGEPEALLVDGVRVPEQWDNESVHIQAIVDGDALSFSIAAASIIAKVTRDRIMVEMDEQHPAYGFAKHKGYATKAHREAIMSHGPCVEHRWSFAPVKSFPPLQ